MLDEIINQLQIVDTTQKSSADTLLEIAAKLTSLSNEITRSRQEQMNQR